MRQYKVKRVLTIIVACLYSFMLMRIVQGVNLFGDMVTIIVVVLAILIGSTGTLLLSKDKAQEEYVKDKLEKDERYINIRKTFSFYFIIVVAGIIPIILVLLNLNGIEQVSLSSLAIFLIAISLIYTIMLDIIRKKV
ncbi:2'-O-methyl transferase [Listeria welshimeri]|uniref:2'-O-methyl transferase n=1 Tax=Listeria welshimeri TaxID=1643 RepID=UPI0018883BC7|nr:2'-O-methyl transferase [Listeria welshimeri]MBF2444086.1 2'-O-methyl transferase [Listeria welshimeri]